jgi:protein-tyrosine phosphatase
MTTHRREHDAFHILFVCTGNVCRSPVAEILTRQFLREKLGRAASGFRVTSAGTESVAGTRMDSRSAASLAAYGLGAAADEFRTRRLEATMVSEADLVLTAERKHRRSVVMLEPAALATTFCFRELVRLLDGIAAAVLPDDPLARARAAVGLARQQRGMGAYAPGDADTIPDPLARPVRECRASVELIAATARAFVDFLKAPRKDTR